jgi:hypothetical protein
MILTTIGALMFAYTIFIRPFTTKTEINDPRMDNLYWFVGSLSVLLTGAILGI